MKLGAITFASCALFFTLTALLAAQTFENDEEALLHVKVLSAFKIGCLENAPDFSKSWAGFAAAGWQVTSTGRYIGAGGRVIALTDERDQGTFRVCAVALKNGNIPAILNIVQPMVTAAWQEKGDFEQSLPSSGDVIYQADLQFDEIFMAAEIRRQGSDVVTVSVTAGSATGFQ